MTYVGKQLNNPIFLKESYEFTAKQPFGHLLIDLDPKTSDSLRYCSNIVQPGPTIFYLPSSKAVITTLTAEREKELCMRKQMLELPGSNLKKSSSIKHQIAL